jgi:small subunit ribosomal protein S1
MASEETIRTDLHDPQNEQEQSAPTPEQSPSPISTLKTADHPETRPAQGNRGGHPRHEKETMEDFATALETFEQEQTEAAAQAEDRVLKGTVVSINNNYLVVDVGQKSEGVVPLEEVKDHEGNVKFQPGAEIDVIIEKGHTEEGYVNLSHQKAQRLHAWDEIEKAYNEKSSIKGRVIDRIKGGLTVDIMGARAFLPGSQVDLRPIRNLDGMKGHDLDVRIIKLNKKRGNIVVSRKQLLEEEVGAKRDETLKHLEEGAVLTGTVKNLTDYGAFVDLGGIDGLLHINDMSC